MFGTGQPPTVSLLQFGELLAELRGELCALGSLRRAKRRTPRCAIVRTVQSLKICCMIRRLTTCSKPQHFCSCSTIVRHDSKLRPRSECSSLPRTSDSVRCISVCVRQ